MERQLLLRGGRWNFRKFNNPLPLGEGRVRDYDGATTKSSPDPGKKEREREHQFGDYVADFYCHDAQLVIECDGSAHQLKG